MKKQLTKFEETNKKFRELGKLEKEHGNLLISAKMGKTTNLVLSRILGGTRWELAEYSTEMKKVNYKFFENEEDAKKEYGEREIKIGG